MGFLDPPAYSRAELHQLLDDVRHAAVSPALAGAEAAQSGEARLELDGDGDVFSHAASSWMEEAGPQARLRVSRSEPDDRGGRHFLIGPYRYGMAIEYDGVVECWVEEWSIHNHAKGEGHNRPARLWVGNNEDTGGLFLSAVDVDDGSTRYAEIVAQRFNHESNGDMRFVVRDADADHFSFRFGPPHAEDERVRIDAGGVRAPALAADLLEAVDSGEVVLGAHLRWEEARTRLQVGGNGANAADELPDRPARYLEVRAPDGELLLVPAYRAEP
jgi:hypothetical protein